MAMIHRIRKNFGRSFLSAPLPNLIELQEKSYADFLQADIAPENRKDSGLQNVFKSMFPIHDYAGLADLEFIEYHLDEPNYTVEECMVRNMTYSTRLRLKLRLILWEIDATTGAKSLRDIKDQEIFMGDIPLMTNRGTFISNGFERVIISQMHRSPGVVYSTARSTHANTDQLLYTARIIPERGSWIDFELDHKDVIYVRIDRKRKVPATVLLRALPAKSDESAFNKDPKHARISGMNNAEILSNFYSAINLEWDGKQWIGDLSVFSNFPNFRLGYDLLDPKSKKIIAAKSDRLNPRKVEKLLQSHKQFALTPESLLGEFLFDNIMDEKSGEALFPSCTEITEELIRDFTKLNVKKLSLISIDHINYGAHVRNTLVADHTDSRDAALIELYNVIRPGERPTVESAMNLFTHIVCDPAYYDLSAVGRFKMNTRLQIKSTKKPEEERILTKNDILRTLQVLANIKDGKDSVDDIDHLGNRRVRAVGELLENQFRIGLTRIERLTREQLSSPNISTLMPQDVMNAKPLISLITEFFGSSQLSQFMDQENPLAELENKRLITALGPGGLHRERASLDVRDVHPTHYGRICPIQTPEGANIGLINHLSVYARVNPYGFIETPYRVVKKGKVTDEVIYLTASEEAGHKIAQGNTPLNNKGEFVEENVTARIDGEFDMVDASEIDLIDYSPKQIVSLSTGLIPFVENDDANRALMGSNMQRQGVPLIRSDAPFVGTGIEREVARDSRSVEIALHSGVVESVDANRIVIKNVNSRGVVTGVDIYNLLKFARSNQETLIHQKPLVKIGDKVSAGDIIADGASTDHGELALGRNVLVAFMPWRGYNYEDSIVISERIARDDVFTSIHIKEYSFRAQDTQLGPEAFTRDIPNVSEDALKNLDESGIIYIGAHVKAGDILVGKVSPKSETLLTPEENLLRNIFGEKALNVKDTSLRVNPGDEGIVVGVTILSRHGVAKDERSQMIELHEIERINKNRIDEFDIMEKSFADQIVPLVRGQTLTGGTGSLKNFVGKKLSDDVIDAIKRSDLKKIVVKDATIQEKVTALRDQHLETMKSMEERFEHQIEKAREGNSLAAGVLKEVKVFIAHKTKLQPGDKMAGRHGNKGIVSRVVPLEDMPHLADGTPVDLVLNPLGVPSRMNVGQILETHLGWAAAGLGKQIDAMLDSIKNKKSTTDDLRGLMGKIYGKSVSESLDKMTDTDVRAQANLVRRGVPMATPTFDGATEEDIHNTLKMAKLDPSGQVTLYDGLTGEPFDRKVTVGYMYMMKLSHLVDNKLHARSTGPYSLITQQPLSGKAHFGGQRLGEMEVWALEAHGAAHVLKEMLTVKSDDITGRNKMYESVISGNTDIQTGTPEGFNVLIRELRAIGLSMTPKKSISE